MAVQIHKDFSRLSEQDLSISVQLVTGARTATEDDDFSFDAASFIFLPSDQEMDVPLTILNDNIPEGLESFTLRVVYTNPLSDPQNISTEIFISDDDSKYRTYVAHTTFNTASLDTDQYTSYIVALFPYCMYVRASAYVVLCC